MAKIVKNPDVRRQELIEIALKQFMERGYEKTSIRSIVKEACGEIGMFYHYFDSKNAIYEAALCQYNEQYIEEAKRIVVSSISIEKKINALFMQLGISLNEYSGLHSDKTNPDIMTILHTRTLHKMVPLVVQLLDDGIEEKKIVAPIQENTVLAEFLLFGISGIIHDSQNDFQSKAVQISELLNHIICLEIHFQASGKEGGI